MIDGNTLKNEVLSRLELAANTETITRFKVWENINAAIVRILRLFPIEIIDNALKTARADLKSGQGSYQWPSDFLRVFRLRVDYSQTIDNSNTGVDVDLYNDNSPAPLDRRGSVFLPFAEVIEGGFKLFPVPSSNVTHGIELKYVYRLPTVSSTQVCLLREDLRNAIVSEAASLCCYVDGYDTQLGADLHSQFIEEFKMFSGRNF